MSEPASPIINRFKTNIAICEALGLDPSKLSSVTIKLDHGQPRVEITMFLSSPMTDRLAPVLSEFNLVEKIDP